MTLLAAETVTAHYGRIEALHAASLSLERSEAVAIIGPNGAGKTTLLRTLSGLMRPSAGRILFRGRDVSTWTPERRARHGLVLVPEGRQVFPGLSVRDNLLLGGYGRRFSGRLRSEISDVESLFPVLAERARQAAGTLSGGEQQMLALGRALMARPEVLLLDEPSLGLAPMAVREVVAKLVELRRRETTILLVEQNAAAAFKVAHRGYVLERGRIVLSGTTDELSEDPRVRRAYLGVEARDTADAEAKGVKAPDDPGQPVVTPAPGGLRGAGGSYPDDPQRVWPKR